MSSINIPAGLIKTGKPADVKVYGVLCQLADQHGVIEKAQRRISDDAGMSNGAVVAALERLAAAGWVTEIDTPEVNRPTQYVITEPARESCSPAA